MSYQPHFAYWLNRVSTMGRVGFGSLNVQRGHSRQRTEVCGLAG